ncbi:MAG: GntR family transcriptional regulator [Chloroflexi bacterium]|nr:MAG: GntR family transcriptional regulator [Chloroflexota bacterium]
MKLHLDFRSGVPIYVQIMEHIKELVVSGELKPGEQLPTVRQLATDLRVNFNTVARAYRMLDDAGIISTQHGRGTYIWDIPDEETSHKLRQESLEAITKRYLIEAKRMNCEPDEVEAMFKKILRDWIGETDDWALHQD